VVEFVTLGSSVAKEVTPPKLAACPRVEGEGYELLAILRSEEYSRAGENR
jgi:hypothetical protein